jgi:hypothetical protein
VAASIVGGLALIGALLSGLDRAGTSAEATRAAVETAAQTTIPPSPSTSPPTTPPETTSAPTTSPPTTIPQVTVPGLLGLDMRTAKNILSDRGLRASVIYKTTARFPSGTVISQSRKGGSSVRAGSAVTLAIAKAPPPSSTPPSTSPPQTASPGNCDPAYPDDCLQDGIGDYDCSAGTGNGPNYVDGPLTVRPPDPFGLDANHDGVGCEEG